MLRLLKVATPFCGVTTSVPERGPVPPTRESWPESFERGTKFPLQSSTATVTAGAIVVWATALEGCWTKTSFAWRSVGEMVSVDEATELCDPCRTAIACTVG